MFFDILYNITLPVFLLIGAGVIADRAYKPDVTTLTRLAFNLLLPALVFIKTLDAGISPGIFGSVAGINIGHTFLIFFLSWGIFSLPNLKSHRQVASLAAVTPNAGNYGIPLAALAYGAEGAHIMAIIVMIQIFFTISAGVWIVDARRTNPRDALIGVIKLPLFWSAVLALLLSALGVELPPPLRASSEYLAAGLVPVALITLGIQLNRSRAQGDVTLLSWITLLRLIVSPLMAWGLVWLWRSLTGIDLGLAAPVLIIAAGMPVAVNVFILASEYNRDAQLASQSIFWTTLLSAVSLTAWIAILKG